MSTARSTVDRTEQSMTRVVIIDDHELVRDGIRVLLEGEPDLTVVGEASTVAEGVRRAAFEEPDLVVLDVDLPDGSGVEACARIRTMFPETRIVMLTGYADPLALAASREAGADGFVLKRIRDFDLVDAIRRVLAGEEVFGDAPPPVEQADPVLSRLTEREIEILELITEGKTNREIAAEVCLAEKTVKNYVSNLLTKMGTAHRAGAAAYLAERRSRPARPPTEWPAT